MDPENSSRDRHGTDWDRVGHPLIGSRIYTVDLSTRKGLELLSKLRRMPKAGAWSRKRGSFPRPAAIFGVHLWSELIQRRGGPATRVTRNGGSAALESADGRCIRKWTMRIAILSLSIISSRVACRMTLRGLVVGRNCERDLFDAGFSMRGRRSS